MKKIVLAFLVLALATILIPGVGAVETKSGDQIVIDEPINDDLFATGGTIVINAEINGDIFASAGTIEINAPVTGDLFVAGGQIIINADIDGKIIAAGGMISIKGKAEKVMVAGGTITFESTAVIEKYVFAAGGTVSNAGEIKEDFYVATETFQNTGTVRGTIEVEEPPSFTEEMKAAVGIMAVMWKIGYFILGLIFIKWFSGLFFAIQKELQESWVKKLVVGFLVMILTLVGFLIVAFLSIFLIGLLILPATAVVALFYVMALMVSGIIVSYAFGQWLLKLARIETHWVVGFLIGFILMNILFVIPFIGTLIQVIVASLGFGALFYTVKNNWATITASPA